MSVESLPLMSEDEIAGTNVDDLSTADAPGTVEKRPVRAKSATKRVAKTLAAPVATVAVSRPFSMSYDGVSSRQYLEQTLVRRQS